MNFRVSGRFDVPRSFLPTFRHPNLPTLRAVARHGFLVLLCLWVLLPLAWLVLTSLKSVPDATQRYIWPKEFAHPIWARYEWIWREFTLDNAFYRSYWNSIVVTSLTVLSSTVAAVLAGYALTLLRTPGRRPIMAFLVATLFFPTQVTAVIGIFSIHDDLDLIGKTWSLFFPYTALTLGLSIFVMRASFQLVSTELIDSARIDGAGTFRTLLGIVLPLVRGGIVVVAVLNFNAAWGEYVLASVLVNDRDQWTLAVLMGRGAGGPSGATLFIVALIPALIIFGLAQSRLYRGLQEGALKA
jgi:ABC-type glycerol-3-phosphate transport system permease component